MPEQTMTQEVHDLIQLVLRAKSSRDVIGSGDPKAQLRKALALLHPDRQRSIEDKTRATQAFAKLQEMVAAEDRKASAKFEVASRKRTYHVDGLAFTGKVTNLYNVTYERDGAVKTGLLKLPRNAADNDLVTGEAQTLKKIWASDDTRLPFFNRLEDVFRYRDKDTGVVRHAVVVRRLDGFLSLREVLDAFGGGLDGRDLAWIWRRALYALSLLFELEIVHGAMTPEHILIHPEQHGLQLCGFTGAVEVGEPLKIMGGWAKLYPPEATAKQPATTATDIYTLSLTMAEALRLDAPQQLYSFIKGCAFGRQAVRPQNPARLLVELDELLERLYGPRKFRVFPDIPGRSK